MSEQIFPGPGGSVDGLSVTSYSGGMVHGPCLQFTCELDQRYAQLNRSEVADLLQALEGWLYNTKPSVPPDTEKAAARGPGATTSIADKKGGTE